MPSIKVLTPEEGEALGTPRSSSVILFPPVSPSQGSQMPSNPPRGSGSSPSQDTAGTSPSIAPTQRLNSMPKWHPLDDQEQFAEDNAPLMEKLLASAQARREASNDPAADPLTQLREEILGRPLTPAEKALLDVTGF